MARGKPGYFIVRSKLLAREGRDIKFGQGCDKSEQKISMSPYSVPVCTPTKATYRSVMSICLLNCLKLHYEYKTIKNKDYLHRLC